MSIVRIQSNTPKVRRFLTGRISAVVPVLGVLLAGSLGAWATDYFWDLNGNTTGSGVGTTTGTWDGTTANWNDLLDGMNTPGVWSPGNVAVFAAGTDSTGTYAVTVSGTQSVSGLRFEEGTVTLSGGTISLTGATPSISVTGTQTISSVLAGGSGFDKTGAGTLVVTGTNTLTGATTISQGTIKYGNVTGSGTYSFGLGSSVTVKSGAVLDFAALHASTTQTMTWNVAPVTLESGATWRFRAQTGSNVHNASNALSVSGSVTIDNNGGSYAQDINLSGKVSGSGTINYLASSGSGSTTTTRTLTLSNAATDFSGTWFVDYTGSTTDDFVALKATAAGALGTGSVTLDDRAQLINGTTGGLNSLASVTIQKATSTVDAGPGWTNAAATLNLTTGTVKVGTSATSFGTINLGTINQSGGSLALDINAAGNDSLVAGSFNATGGAIDLVFTNSAPQLGTTYTLLTYGTLTGTPTVNNPTRFTPAFNYGSGTNGAVTVSFSGATANLVWSGATSNVWNLGTTANFTNGGSADVFKAFDSVTFDDTTTSNLSITVGASMLASNVTFNNTTNAYSLTGAGGIGGPAAVTKTGNGTLTFGTTGNSYTGATTISAGTVKLGASNVIPDGVGFGSVAVDGTLDLNTFSDTINGLSGGGTILNSGATASTITVGGGDATTFSGLIQNGTSAVALTKTGLGTLTLNNTNSYTGATTVTGGTLRLIGPNSLTGSLVLNGATAVVRLDSLSQLPAGVLTLNNGGVLQTNGTFLRAQGAGAGQVNNTAGFVGFSAVGGSLVINLGGAGAAVTNATGGFNSGGFILNDASATDSLIFQNPLTITVSNPFTVQVDATTPGVTTTLSGNVSSVNALAKTGAGTLIFTGATNALTGGLVIGSGGNGGTVEVTSGVNITAATGSRLMVGYAANSATVTAAGTLNVDANAGTLTFGGNSLGAANYIAVDGGTTAARTTTATVNANGGTLNFNGMASGAGFLYIGANSGYATGVLNIASGATVNVGTRVGLGAVGNATAGVMGTGNSSNATIGILNGSINLNGGTLNIGTGSSADTDRGFLYLSNDGNTTGVATVNLNGGALSLAKFAVGNGAGTSAKTILFNGTMVKPIASRTDFLDPGVNASYRVQTGGAIFDTGLYAVTVKGTLAHDSALGATPDGGVVVNGSGTLTLAGTQTYTGPTVVNSGTLAVNGTLGAGAVTVADGGTISGSGTIGGSLTLGSATGGTILASGKLSVGGAFVANGTTYVLVSPGSWLTPGGPLPILSAASMTATASSFFPLVSEFRKADVSITGNTVYLDLGVKALTWTGAASGNWLLMGESNWKDATQTADTFYTGDAITFDDSATTTNSTVTVGGTVTPSSVTVNNSAAVPYTLKSSGGGAINGAGSLVKKGNGVLNMGLANSYSGGTTISQGSVYISSAGSLGTGPVTLGDASTGNSAVALYSDGARLSYTLGALVSSNGTGTVTIGSRSTVTGTGDNNNFNNIVLQRDLIIDSNAADRTDYRNISGTGNITVIGSGRTIFSNTVNTFVGDITVATGAATFFQSGVATAGNQNYIPDASSVTVQAGSRWAVSSGGETINALKGGGLVNVNSINATLTVGGADGSGEFSGVLANATQTLALTKIGAGTQILSGLNTYTGATTVSAGTLTVNGSISASATTVNGATATLAGTGTTGAVTLTSGTLTAGNGGIGTLSTGALNLNGGAALFELSGLTSDKFNVTGAVAFGGPVALSLSFSSDLADGTAYTLIANDGADLFSFAPGGGFTISGTPVVAGVPFAYTSGSFNEIFQLSYTGNDTNDAVLTVVPEPGAALLLLGGLGALLARRRRRR